MKKIILLILVLSLTGCVSNEDFTKTCKIVNNSEDLLTKEKMQVNFNNKDTLTNVTITRTYEASGDNGLVALESVKESINDYNNALLNKKGIKISIDTDTEEKYIVKYYVDVATADEDVLEIFNLQTNSIKFFGKMRENNIKCE